MKRPQPVPGAHWESGPTASELGRITRVGLAAPSEPGDPGPGIALEVHFPGETPDRVALLGPEDVPAILDQAVILAWAVDREPIQ